MDHTKEGGFSFRDANKRCLPEDLRPIYRFCRVHPTKRITDLSSAFCYPVFVSDYLSLDGADPANTNAATGTTAIAAIEGTNSDQFEVKFPKIFGKNSRYARADTSRTPQPYR